MTRLLRVEADTDAPPELIGSKAAGLITLQRLGLPVPPAFVITTEAHRRHRRARVLGDDLRAGIRSAITELGRSISARSGAQVSMPGMMRTVLDLPTTDPGRIERAVLDVFASWDSPQATTYRALHDIDDDLGTAVLLQTMVYGDHDQHSGAGVAFSRNPLTGEPTPYGEVLFGHQGEEVVSGGSVTQPLIKLAEQEPRAWAELLDAMAVIESEVRDACYLEFTVQAGRLWLLQVRPARLRGIGGIRVAIDLLDSGVIDSDGAAGRITAEDVDRSRSARLDLNRIPDDAIVGRGIGACPGIASGHVATSADQAVSMAADGPVILVRPETSPTDLHGFAVAAGVLTARGGPAGHAAVVARSMGLAAVVGAGELGLETGTMITVDGGSGVVIRGRTTVADEQDPDLTRLIDRATRLLTSTDQR